MSPFKLSDFGGVTDKYDSSRSLSKERGTAEKQNHFFGVEEWGESLAMKPFCSQLVEYQHNTTEGGLTLSKYQHEQEAQVVSAFGCLDALYFDAASPSFQSCSVDITKHASVKAEDPKLIEPQKEKTCIPPSASLAILNNYQSRFRRLNGKKIDIPSYVAECTKVSGQKLSTDAIIRLGGERFIHSRSQSVDDMSVLSHPYACSFSTLSPEETRDIELIEYLLASTEKLGEQQFDRASKILNRCDELCSSKGDPVKRLVYYFVEALRERIERETGRIASKGLWTNQALDVEEVVVKSSHANVAFHQEVPFAQVSQLTGVQSIVENVGEAKKVHIVDLMIMNGSHSIVLMQALAARCQSSLEHLRITAIGTKSKHILEGTGKRLMTFAESMNLSFSFNVVMVADMLDLNIDLFELDPEETIAVHSSYFLSSMIVRPDRLECLFRVIKSINPCVMVITEAEANHNSPVFVNRFIEALFFYGAIFDSLGDCMSNADQNRMILESVYFSPAIRSIVAFEGEERTIRQVNMTVWRAFFARFGMVELELSMSSLYQANLVLKNFSRGSSCTLDMDGKCLSIGWKGTPIHSLSAWKFI